MNSLLVLMLSMARADAAFDHSHAAFASFLSGAVSESGVDYGLLATRRAKLDEYLASVKSADLTGWTDAQKLAFYVNAYNAYTLALMLDSGPPASITNLDGGKVWDTRKFKVAGQELTLNQMEHEHARKLGDGRVHGVINCASKGCPPLAPAPLTETGQASQLDEGVKRWVRTNAFRMEGDTIHLSMIFDWYGEDFARYKQGDLAGVDGEPENALWFLSKYVDETTKKRLLSGSLTAGWNNYDWAINKK